MQAEQLYKMIGNESAPEDLAAVIDVDTSETFTIEGVRREEHEEANGSATLWIKVSKN